MGSFERVQLLSPAGSFESLAAAIQGGADAVYFGVDHLNMRARSAGNFRIGDLPEIRERCSNAGVRCYLTLNTIIYDHDMRLVERIVDTAAENHMDGIIACDMAVLEYAAAKNLPVHISTQANVSNYPSVRYFARYADVIVLARELTLQQVKSIVSSIRQDRLTGPSGKELKIEIFGHGALCMAISGKCYLSLHAYNASANRGACKQNCRERYEVEDQEGNRLAVENEYIMSSKDLQTISFLDKVLDAGVSVLKLEGRGRSPEYVLEVTSCYREAIDSYYDGTYGDQRIEGWVKRLSTVYNRGFWDGYYLGRKLGAWAMTGGSNATKVKEYIGKGRNYYEKAGAGEFLMEAGRLEVGDEVLITGPNTGVVKAPVNELRVGDVRVSSVSRGEIFSMLLPGKIRRSDKLYKLVSKEK